jgi:DNA-binding NarL/FixJ family response regulator
MMTDKKQLALLVDDSPLQAESFTLLLQRAGWDVRRAVSAQQAHDVVRRAAELGETFALYLIDLCLPPDIHNPFANGIPLIQQLRAGTPQMPILAYSAITADTMPYERILQALLPLRVSFLYTRQMGNVELPTLLELVWNGYVFVSPAPAQMLPFAIPQRPDPLSATDWEILRHMSAGGIYQQIANEIDGLSEAGVRNRVAQIKITLIDEGWLEEFQTSRVDLINWYNAHATRYGRLPAN